jgi:hypothetical protein
MPLFINIIVNQIQKNILLMIMCGMRILRLRLQGELSSQKGAEEGVGPGSISPAKEHRKLSAHRERGFA